MSLAVNSSGSPILHCYFGYHIITTNGNSREVLAVGTTIIHGRVPYKKGRHYDLSKLGTMNQLEQPPNGRTYNMQHFF